MRLARAAAVLASLALLPGCAALALSAVGPAAEFGIDKATSGDSDKTFTAPVANLRLAALKTLSRMDMNVTKDGGTENKWEIEAEAGDRTVDVDLTSLTAMTTRLSVAADRGTIFFKDSATAQEVVAQITEALKRDAVYGEQAALNDLGGE